MVVIVVDLVVVDVVVLWIVDISADVVESIKVNKKRQFIQRM